MTKLDELIQCIKSTHVYVQMHNYPDQDALASAMGLQALLQSRGIQVTIIYHGVIDKDNTLKMIEMLQIDIHKIENLNLTPEDEVIIVDCQKGNKNVLDTNGTVIACIDHHDPKNTYTYRFFDIRNNVGACCSIIASYFFENQVTMTTNIATALVYGLKIDTGQLLRRISTLDIDMFCYLFKLADANKLRIFEKSSMKLVNLANYQHAITDLRLDSNIAIANIGNDCPEAIIGSVNDFLLTTSEIEFTIIYSYRDEGIKFSVRSALSELDANEILHNALLGYGDGGGRSDIAAGFVPNVSEGITSEESVNQIISRIIQLVRKNTA